MGDRAQQIRDLEAQAAALRAADKAEAAEAEAAAEAERVRAADVARRSKWPPFIGSRIEAVEDTGHKLFVFTSAGRLEFTGAVWFDEMVGVERFDDVAVVATLRDEGGGDGNR